MVFELLHLGFGNRVLAERVVAIMSPNSEPIRRLVQEAKSNSRLLNMTHAHKTKSVILLDTGHVVVAAMSPETVALRLAAQRQGGSAKPEPEQELT